MMVALPLWLPTEPCGSLPEHTHAAYTCVLSAACAPSDRLPVLAAGVQAATLDPAYRSCNCMAVAVTGPGCCSALHPLR